MRQTLLVMNFKVFRVRQLNSFLIFSLFFVIPAYVIGIEGFDFCGETLEDVEGEDVAHIRLDSVELGLDELDLPSNSP
jgi:hypothetical protein